MQEFNAFTKNSSWEYRYAFNVSLSHILRSNWLNAHSKFPNIHFEKKN